MRGVDAHERLEQLRHRRESMVASGVQSRGREQELANLDAEIAEAEGASLTGSGQPRTDTRLEGAQARCYIAAMMRQGPRGMNAHRLALDARNGTRRALNRLRLTASVLRSTVVAHARMSGTPRRPGHARRPPRGPARAAPARPRLAEAA